SCRSTSSSFSGRYPTLRTTERPSGDCTCAERPRIPVAASPGFRGTTPLARSCMTSNGKQACALQIDTGQGALRMGIRYNEYGQPIGPAVPDWSPCPRPPRTELVGRYCRLEPVNAVRHEAVLFGAYMQAPDDRDWTYLFVERPASRDDFHAYLIRLESSEDPLHFTIVEAQTGGAAGTAALMRIDPAHGSIEVGA